MNKNILDYLNISDALDIVEKNGLYLGKIVPENFSLWKNYNPTLLFIEGINQFCVKVIRNAIKISDTSERLLPAQIKDLNLFKTPTYDPSIIEATFQKEMGLYITNFKTFDMSKKIISSEGKIYVSKIKFSSLNA